MNPNSVTCNTLLQATVETFLQAEGTNSAPLTLKNER
jgi:hypothetical protein